jgi:uncharacterized protein (DUF433 family)
MSSTSEVKDHLKEFVVYASLDEASRLTGLSERQIRSWHAAGVITPFLVRELPRGARARLFDFTDMVSLRILQAIRGRVAPEELGKVQVALKARGQHDWGKLRVDTNDRKVRIAETTEQGELRFQQDASIDIDEVASGLKTEIEQSIARAPSVIGKIVRDPAVVGGAWIVAGTRIPTELIWSFHEAGYNTQSIIAQYPRLQPEDVAASIAHERRLREQGAA